jgi:PAXNEB protein
MRDKQQNTLGHSQTCAGGATTSFSRRNLLKMGAALAAVPLVGDLPATSTGEKRFSTGSPELDHSLGGGLRLGTFLAVAGARSSGKTAFFLRLAKANGILDAHPMSTGTSDMLSVMEREDGKYIGSLMLDCVEPSTDKEREAMDCDPAARDAFLSRWFQRTREVTHASGGIFAISVCQPIDASAAPAWLGIPDYVITVNQSTASVLKHV